MPTTNPFQNVLDWTLIEEGRLSHR